MERSLLDSEKEELPAHEWTKFVGRGQGSSAVTFPALWCGQRATLLVPEDVRDVVELPNAGMSIISAPRTTFIDLFRTAGASPGMRPKNVTSWLFYGWENVVQNHFDSIPIDRIRVGMNAVPKQNDNWSCGINSIARMMAMTGNPIFNYDSFRRRAPKAFSFFGAGDIGPQPKQLRMHLENYHGLRSPRPGENCTNDFEFTERLFNKAIAQGRPSMILYQVDATKLHWGNLVGIDRSNGKALVLDTNGHLGVWQGGRDEIWGRMWIANHAACKFGFLSPYNSITCTND